MMKRIVCVFSLAIALGACAGKADAPRIELTDIGFTLHLPPPMQRALDSLAPGFHTVRATSFRSDVSQAAAAVGGAGMPAAFAAIGDYDRDGTVDAVVEGTAPGDSALRVIAILNGAKPTAVEITRFPVYDADAVGVYLSNPAPGAAGAFDVVAYPDSSVRYSWSAGAFHGSAVGN